MAIWRIIFALLGVVLAVLNVALGLIVSFPRYVWGSWNFLLAVKRWRQKGKPTHGDASFALDKTLKQRGYLNPQGALMGISPKGRRFYGRDERSVILMAPPGAGKSQHFIADLRQVLARPPAKLPFLIIGDAADELYRKLAPRMQSAGYEIAKIDVPEPHLGTKLDILSGIHPGNPDDPDDVRKYTFYTKVEQLCEAMIPDEPNSKNPHFVDFTRLLLSCAVIVDIKYEGNQRPVGDIIDMLVDDEARGEMLKRAEGYKDPHLRATLRTMAKFQDKPEGLSMMSTSLRKLKTWNHPAVREITTFGPDMNNRYTRGWNFSQMLSQEKPVVVFIRSGYQDAGSSLTRIVYNKAISEIAELWDATGTPLPRDLLIYIDEAGMTGYCPAFVRAFSRLRKVGVRLRMAFVGMEEFRETYANNSKTILDGCDLVVYGGSSDMDLNEYASKRAGETTVQSRSENESDHGQSKGKSEQPRRLVKFDEFTRLDLDRQVAFIDNLVVKGPKTWRKVTNRWTGQESITYL